MKHIVKSAGAVFMLSALYCVPFSIVSMLLQPGRSFQTAYLHLFLPSLIGVVAGISTQLKRGREREKEKSTINQLKENEEL